MFIAVSADGYIARPDGSVDWLKVVEREGEDYGYQRFAGSVDALVMGRKTYDTVVGFGAWPFEGKRVVVLTHRPGPSLHGEEHRAGPVRELAETLAAQGVRHVYVDGGEVIRQFLAAGLIDDITLSLIPIVLGRGLRLFAGGEPEVPLVLEESRAYPSGLVQLRYRLAR